MAQETNAFMGLMEKLRGNVEAFAMEEEKSADRVEYLLIAYGLDANTQETLDGEKKPEEN